MARTALAPRFRILDGDGVLAGTALAPRYGIFDGDGVLTRTARMILGGAVVLSSVNMINAFIAYDLWRGAWTIKKFLYKR